MIQIFKLTKRHVDKRVQDELPQKYKQILLFSTNVGHGVGTLDFSQLMGKISNDEFDKILNLCDEYAKFKLGHLNKFGEIEVFPEHAQKLLQSVPEGKLKDILNDLDEGYLVLRKDFYE